MTITLVKQGKRIVDPDGIDPDADLDYELDWVDWLPLGDSLAQVTATGVNCTAHTPAVNGTKTTAWVKDAVDGETAVLTFHITTAQGRKEDASIYMKVRSK